MRVVRRDDGSQAAEPCDCRHVHQVASLLRRASIPKRYEHCTLESFDPTFNGSHESLRLAYRITDQFVTTYPVDTEGRGILYTGTMGVGKTHLAVGLLHALITERGAQGLFCDYRELLKQIQESYNPSTHVTELQVLRPIFQAEVLLLDDLGYIKPTEWVWDTVALILNARYNAKKTTIITTNYPNLPAKSLRSLDDPKKSRQQRDAEDAMREETLGDRIGDRMWSRLAEMCIEVNLVGQDLRQSVKRARFG